MQWQCFHDKHKHIHHMDSNSMVDRNERANKQEKERARKT